MQEALQLFARSLFAYISVDRTAESEGPYIFLAFLAFAVAEPIRYPYYLLKKLEMEDTLAYRIFGHLRYNCFIVFYPIGAFGDMMAGVHSAPATGHLSMTLPNSWNWSFSYPFFISRVLPFLYLCQFPLNYMYLLEQRKRYYQGSQPAKVKQH